jgi:hypothetical protein
LPLPDSSGGYKLYANLITERVTNQVSTGLAVGDGSWVADSERLAITIASQPQCANRCDEQLWVVNYRTGETQTLLGGFRVMRSPVVSPDQTRIAAVCSLDPQPPPIMLDLCIVTWRSP